MEELAGDNPAGNKYPVGLTKEPFVFVLKYCIDISL